MPRRACSLPPRGPAESSPDSRRGSWSCSRTAFRDESPPLVSAEVSRARRREVQAFLEDVSCARVVRDDEVARSHEVDRGNRVRVTHLPTVEEHRVCGASRYVARARAHLADPEARRDEQDIGTLAKAAADGTGRNDEGPRRQQSSKRALMLGPADGTDRQRSRGERIEHIAFL